MMHLNKFLIILFLCLMQIVFSQATLQGKVTDYSTKEPIGFASIALCSATDSSLVKGELADSLGNFRLSGIANGSYFLKVSFPAFKDTVSDVFEINDEQNKLVVFSFALTPSSQVMDEFTVTAEKPAFNREFDKTVIDVGNVLFKTAASLLDVLRRAPGIQVDSEGNVKLKNNVSPVVLIDGKPVPMSAEELNNYLNTLSPDQVESIEIIDNPSAKYDAEYKGIINIVLKRDLNLGWNGSVSTFLVQNTYFNPGSTGATASYKTKKLNLYGTYWYNRQRNATLGHLSQVFSEDAEMLSVSAKGQRLNSNNSAQLGMDYLISPKQTIGLLVKGYDNWRDGNQVVNSDLYALPVTAAPARIITSSTQLRRFRSYAANAAYEAEFGKNGISANASWTGFHAGDDQEVADLRNDGTVRQLRNFTVSNIEILAGQLDYVHSFKKSKLEMGAKAGKTNTNNDLKYDTLVNNLWQPDLDKRNQFAYDEMILAQYISFQRPIGEKWQLQLGLRGENTHTKGISVSDGSVVERNYYKLLPSFNLAYTINKNSSIDLALSRRLERPTFQSLNPFRFYVSPYSFTEGNPFLLPVTVSMANLNYTFKKLFVSLSCVNYQNYVSQVPFVDANNVTGYRIVNFGNVTESNIGAGYNTSVFKWWNMQHYIAFLYLDQNVYYNGNQSAVKNLSFNLNGNQVFELPKGFVAELSYFYVSKCQYNLFTQQPMYGANCAFQKSFLKDQLNVKLSFEDLFYSRFGKTRADNGNLQITHYEKHDTRYVKLFLAYKFGKSIYNPKKRPNTEEEDRIKK